jgi:hypothetical protein
MVIDFQHHYIPVQLAKKRGLYSETGMTMLEEGGLRATTMHQRLYDLNLQLDDMAQAGVDLSVLSCLLGWSALVRAAGGMPFHQRRSRRNSKKISAPLRRFGPGAHPGRENGARRIAPGN